MLELDICSNNFTHHKEPRLRKSAVLKIPVLFHHPMATLPTALRDANRNYSILCSKNQDIPSGKCILIAGFKFLKLDILERHHVALHNDSWLKTSFSEMLAGGI